MKNVTERTSVPSVRSDTNLIAASAKVILPKKKSSLFMLIYSGYIKHNFKLSKSWVNISG